MQFVGDAVMAVFAPRAQDDHADRGLTAGRGHAPAQGAVNGAGGGGLALHLGVGLSHRGRWRAPAGVGRAAEYTIVAIR